MSHYSKIFDAMYAAGQPITLSGVWGRVPCHDSFRALPEKSLSEVCKLFSETDLLAAGILTRTEASAEISPLLRQLPVTLLFVRRAGDVGWYQVIANLHGLGPHVGAFAAATQDTQILDWVAQSGMSLALSARMSDLMILWSVGIPAAPATGLAAISRAHLDVLHRRLRQLGDDGMALYLSLVGWNLESLEPVVPAYLRAVERHLRDIHSHLGLSFPKGWWQPTELEFRNLAFALQHGCVEKIAALVQRSYEFDTQLWSDDRTPEIARAGGARDLCDATVRLREAHGRPDGIDRRQAWQDYYESISNAISQPLLAKSLLNEDPEDRARQVAKALFAPMALGELTLLANKMALPSLDPRHAQAHLTERDWQRALEIWQSLQNPTEKAKKRASSG